MLTWCGGGRRAFPRWRKPRGDENLVVKKPRGDEKERVVLNIDNKSAISLCKNPVHHNRSKHIDTKYHYIRECVEESKIEVNYICTDDQLADILTKSLGRLKFLEMRKRIGVQAVKMSTSCLEG
jgi:hypothetical protein